MITRIPDLSLIVAISENGIIGTGDDMPWHISEDLKWFKKKTLDHPIIMGRKTLLSFPRYPLPRRKHIVLSRSTDIEFEGCVLVHDLREAINECDMSGENFIIGGAQVYALFLPLVTKMYITRIHRSFAGIIPFPEYDEGLWELVEKIPGSDPNRKFDYSFLTYQRKKI